MKKLLLTVVKIIVFFIGWALLATVLPIPDNVDGVYWRFFCRADAAFGGGDLQWIVLDH